jgi:transposase InsO family protein
VNHVTAKLKVSERLACRVIGQLRTTQRYVAKVDPTKEKLRERIVQLASEYGRYGYKTITSMLQLEGWQVGKDCVHRVWREEGLQVPQKQPKRARLWLADGSCIRLRPTHRNHVWSYDFVSHQTHDGRKFRILNIIDEFTKECLASFVARRIRSQDVILILADLFIEHGVPEHIRSDNGPEFIAKNLLAWFEQLDVKPLFIEKGSPWENGYCESFNGKMRYQLLDGEIFFTLLEARVIIERWRRHYNEVRPHSSLGGRPPRAPETKEVHIRLVSV